MLHFTKFAGFFVFLTHFRLFHRLGVPGHGIVHDIACGNIFLLCQLKTVMLIEKYVAFLVRLQIRHHVLPVTELQHRPQQLRCDALALGLAGNGKIVQIGAVCRSPSARDHYHDQSERI